MPLDTNTQASVKPALFLAARTGNANVYTPSMTSVQRGEVAKKLNGAADVLTANVRWGAVQESEGEVEETAFRTVYGILRRLAHAVETYTPPVPAPVYEWGQRVMAARHGRPVEAFFVSGPDGDGDLKVVFRGDTTAVCVRAKDVSPITPAAAPEPVTPPTPRWPQVGDLVRFKVHYGHRRPGDLGTIARIDPPKLEEQETIYVVESPGFAADAHCFGSRFDVIRPAGWTPKVGDKVKVAGLSRLGYDAWGDVGTVAAVYPDGAMAESPIAVDFPPTHSRKLYKAEQVYPASL